MKWPSLESYCWTILPLLCAIVHAGQTECYTYYGPHPVKSILTSRITETHTKTPAVTTTASTTTETLAVYPYTKTVNGTATDTITLVVTAAPHTTTVLTVSGFVPAASASIRTSDGRQHKRQLNRSRRSRKARNGLLARRVDDAVATSYATEVLCTIDTTIILHKTYTDSVVDYDYTTTSPKRRSLPTTILL